MYIPRADRNLKKIWDTVNKLSCDGYGDETLGYRGAILQKTKINFQKLAPSIQVSGSMIVYILGVRPYNSLFPLDIFKRLGRGGMV
jgi:hypothetical protein